jgi:hypothetical protein
MAIQNDLASLYKQLEASPYFVDPAEKQKLMDQLSEAMRISNASPFGGLLSDKKDFILGTQGVVQARLKDTTAAGKERKTVEKEVVKVMQQGTNAQIQNLRLQSFLASTGPQDTGQFFGKLADTAVKAASFITKNVKNKTA